MSLIESYNIKEGGFHPFLIRDSWQVAKLNYEKDYHINNIDSLKINQNSDRAMSLLSGKAVLITKNINDNKSQFGIVVMERGISYNIPKNTRYNIAMEEESELFIVEKNNAHDNNIVKYSLNKEELETIRKNVNKILNK